MVFLKRRFNYMFVTNLPTILHMVLNLKSLKLLRDIHNAFKNDKNYSFIKLLKGMFNALKKEKVIKFKDKFIVSSFLPPVPSKSFLSMVLATKVKENIYTQQMLAQRSAPISFFLALTNKCNYDCFHCSAKGRDIGKELTTEEWKKIIKDIQDMGTSIIGFTGGEPLLREDIEEIVEFVDDRSITILYTNGKYLSYEKALNLKNRGLFAVGISLDSIFKEEHNKKRGDQNAFEDSLNAIKNSRKAGLYTIVQSVVPKENVNKEYLFKLFKLAKKMGAHEIRILEPIISGNLFLNKEENKDIFYSKNDREKLIKIQYAANRMMSLPKVTTFAHTESKSQFGCGAGTQHSYITASGDLLPCDFLPLSFGNVREKSIKELWEEMNRIIGIPKIGCFAMEIYSNLYNKKLPLNKNDSSIICAKHKSNEFPKFYKILQGKSNS